MAISVGAIVGSLELTTKKWDSAIDKVKKDQQSLSGLVLRHKKGIEDLGKAVSIAGAAITASLGIVIKKAADAGDEFNDLSQRTGIATELLSGYKLAADKSGTSMEGFAHGMRGLSNQMSAVIDGSKETKAKFDSIGVSVTDNTGKMRPLNEVMLDVADRFAAMPDGAEKSALAMDIFGKSGTDLIPMLNMGKKGLQENYERAEKLGLIYSTKAAKAADEFNDSLAELKGAVTGVGMQIGQALIPKVQAAVEKITGIIVKVKEWAKAHPGLASWLAETAGKVGLFATAAGPLLIVLPKLVSGFQLLKSLASKHIIFTFSIAGAALIFAFVSKFKKDLKDLEDQGATTAEKLRAIFGNFNPFKSLSRESLGQFLKDMGGVVVTSEQALPPMRDLSQIVNALGLNMDKTSGVSKAFTLVLQGLGVKTKTQLVNELKEAEEALSKLKGSAEKAPGPVKTLEDKIKDLREQLTGVKDNTVSWGERLKELGVTTIPDKRKKIVELNKELDRLKKEYETGQVTLEEYTKATKTLKEQVEALRVGVDSEAIPAMRNMGEIVKEAAGKLDTPAYKDWGEELKKLGIDIVPDTADQIKNLQGAISYLDGLLAAEKISPEKYAESIKKISEEMDKLQGKTRKVRSFMEEVSTVVADAAREISRSIVGVFNIKGLLGADAHEVKFDASPYEEMIAAAEAAYEAQKNLIDSQLDAINDACDAAVDAVEAQYDAMVDAADKAYDRQELRISRQEENEDIRLSRQYERAKKKIENSKMSESEKDAALYALEIKYEDDKLKRERAREDAKLAREEEQERKLQAIRLEGARKEQELRDAAAVKQAALMEKLLGIQNAHERDLEKIRQDEETARQTQTDAEEKRQKSLWFKVKGIFATTVEEIATLWMTRLITPLVNSVVEKLFPSLDSIKGKADDVLGDKGVGKVVSDAGTKIGNFFTSLATTISTIITTIATALGTVITTLATAIAAGIVALATGIATAATILAAAAPALLIVAGVALAIYAGFSLVKGLVDSIFGSGGGAGDGMGRVVARQDVQTMWITRLFEDLHGNVVPILTNIQNTGWNGLVPQLNDIKKTAWGMYNYMCNAQLTVLQKIEVHTKATADAIKNITKAANGYEGIVTSPHLFVGGDNGPEHVKFTPMNSTHNSTVNNNGPEKIQVVIQGNGGLTEQKVIDIWKRAARGGQLGRGMKQIYVQG